MLLRYTLPCLSLFPYVVHSLALLPSADVSPHLPSLPPLQQLSLSDQQSTTPSILLPRHGDDEHEAMDHPHDISAPLASPLDTADVIYEPLPPPHSSSHHHGAATPLTVLNETEILLSHKPNPLSYWTHDWNFDVTDERLGGRGQWGGWILFGHAFGMTIGLVLLFPLAHALRATPYSTPILLSTLTCTIIGLISSAVYKSHTPDLYAHNSHAPLGWVVVSLLVFASGRDLWKAAKEVEQGGWRSRLWRLVGVVRRGEVKVGSYEMVGSSRAEEDAEPVGLHTIHEGDEEAEEERFVSSPVGEYEEEVTLFSPSSSTVQGSRRDDELSPRSSTSTLRHHHPHSHSFHHDYNLTPQPSRLQRVVIGAMTVVWFLIPLLGVASFLTGITVYSGSCRAEYVNGCLAHLIKGGIFFFYGLLTFGRYLGAWAQLGWAWNVQPQPSPRRPSLDADGKSANTGWEVPEKDSERKSTWTVPTAEAVECGVMFFYGLTNTWMERFGAAPGSAFTIHQVQHISIALLFFFGGGLGLLLESSLAKRLLAVPVAVAQGRSLRNVEKPPTWTGSFNPFPAVVVGVTGLVMGSHHQTYLFQIQVHALWGNLLALFGVFRILTYTFLWLRPPRSILPSRPPTEALAAFSLSFGGIVFILSNEQVVFGAMRSGWDDIMSFLTFTISSTSFLFIWLFVVLVAKGWATERAAKKMARPLSSRQSSVSLSIAEEETMEGDENERVSRFDRVGGRV